MRLAVLCLIIASMACATPEERAAKQLAVAEEQLFDAVEHLMEIEDPPPRPRPNARHDGNSSSSRNSWTKSSSGLALHRTDPDRNPARPCEHLLRPRGVVEEPTRTIGGAHADSAA